jgi:hypothetical protein
MPKHFVRLTVLASCWLLACRHDTATERPEDSLGSAAVADAPPEPGAVSSEPARAVATPPADAPKIEAPTTAPSAVEAPPSEPTPREPAPREPASSVARSLVAVDGANVTVGDTETEALHLTELACAVDRPLLGSLAVIAALSKQGAALDRCAARGDAAVVHWAFADGRPRDITVRGASTTKVEACIVAALKKVRSPIDARCGAVLHIGDEQGAAEAHARLTPAG